VEMLPSGPCWKYEDIITDCPTKSPLRLFYCDPINCLQSILSDPHLADCINFDCQRVYKSGNRLSHIYSSFMTGDHSWYLQVWFICEFLVLNAHCTLFSVRSLRAHLYLGWSCPLTKQKSPIYLVIDMLILSW
jgi:hypothetical protein